MIAQILLAVFGALGVIVVYCVVRLWWAGRISQKERGQR
jgi:hypothetical protein